MELEEAYNEKEAFQPHETRGFATLRRQLSRIFKNRDRIPSISGSKSSLPRSNIPSSKNSFQKFINDDFELSQKLPVPTNYDIQVYRMEKFPVRPLIQTDELWFHRMDIIDPMSKLDRAKEKEGKLLIVDEGNCKEEPLDARLQASFRRSLRNNVAAIECLFDIDEETKGRDMSTPIGFEYSERVIYRKFYIAWRIGQLFIQNRKKKDVVDTAIPHAATSSYTKPIPFCSRCSRRLGICSFSFCFYIHRGDNYDEQIIRELSVLEFHKKVGEKDQQVYTI